MRMQTNSDHWNCSRMDLETAQKKQRQPTLSQVSFLDFCWTLSWVKNTFKLFINQPGWRGTRASTMSSSLTGPDLPSSTKIATAGQKPACQSQISLKTRKRCWETTWTQWARRGRDFWTCTRITKTPRTMWLTLEALWDAVLQIWPGSKWWLNVTWYWEWWY